MKRSIKRILSLSLLAVILLSGTAAISCSSTSRGSKTSGTMYERKQSNKGSKVKSNIKVRGNNKANGHTTRSY